jgi:serine/threonine protein kinase
LHADPLIGELIDNRYRVIEQIGRGGMGVVYRAHHEVIDRVVAVKFLRKELVADNDQVSRFLLEAKAIAKLKSKHTVTIYDFGTTSEGGLYFAMEFCEGKSLYRLLKEGGRLGWRRAGTLALQACDSLAEAHANGIYHRDVKPENLFVTTDSTGQECIKVLDFGIVKLAQASGDRRLTQQGMVIGTPEYISPEHAQARAIDHRSDIYSLGIVLYEMVSGRPPFRSENTASILLMHLNEQPPPIDDQEEIRLPVRFQELIRACLAKDPSERPQSVNDLAAELRAILDAAGTGETAVLVAPGGQTTRRDRPEKRPGTVAWEEEDTADDETDRQAGGTQSQRAHVKAENPDGRRLSARRKGGKSKLWDTGKYSELATATTASTPSTGPRSALVLGGLSVAALALVSLLVYLYVGMGGKSSSEEGKTSAEDAAAVPGESNHASPSPALPLGQEPPPANPAVSSDPAPEAPAAAGGGGNTAPPGGDEAAEAGTNATADASASAAARPPVAADVTGEPVPEPATNAEPRSEEAGGGTPTGTAPLKEAEMPAGKQEAAGGGAGAVKDGQEHKGSAKGGGSAGESETKGKGEPSGGTKSPGTTGTGDAGAGTSADTGAKSEFGALPSDAGSGKNEFQPVPQP